MFKVPFVIVTKKYFLFVFQLQIFIMYLISRYLSEFSL